MSFNSVASKLSHQGEEAHAFPLKLGWPSVPTGNQQNLAEVMLCDFWCWARKGQAVSALVSWNTHLPDFPSNGAFSGIHLPCCDQPKQHGKTPWRHARWRDLAKPSLWVVLTPAPDMWVKDPPDDSNPQPAEFPPTHWSLPSWGPRRPGAETSHPHCALFEILTHRIHDYNKMVAIFMPLTLQSGLRHSNK